MGAPLLATMAVMPDQVTTALDWGEFIDDGVTGNNFCTQTSRG